MENSLQFQLRVLQLLAHLRLGLQLFLCLAQLLTQLAQFAFQLAALSFDVFRSSLRALTAAGFLG